MYRYVSSSLFCSLLLIGSLSAECWTGHQRPFNSTEPRDNAVPEIPGGKTLTITILDDTGKPIPKARFSYFGQPKPHNAQTHRHYVETGDDGKFTIWFPPNAVYNDFQIEVDTPGYAPYNSQWEKPETDPIPAEFQVQLEKATTIGGIVLDDTGKPLADADVEFRFHWQHRSRVPQICSYPVWVKTDENGAWSCDLIPPAMLKTVDISFYVSYKGLMTYEKRMPLADFAPNADGSFSHTIHMERGAVVKGKITDEAGKPISGAVVFGNYMETREDFTATTNETGDYIHENWPESNGAYIGVWSPGKMSTLKNFTVAKNSSPVVDVTMKSAGKPLKVKIVDKDGKPVQGFYICIERWGEHRLVNEILQTGKPERPQTDENGLWVWNEAPETEVVFDMFRDVSLMDVRNKPMTARDEQYVFTAYPALKITGKVLDDATGQPVPAFKTYLGMKFENSPEMYWDLQANAGRDGAYSLSENYPRPGFGVKIEAEGYEPAVSRDIHPDEGGVTVDFSLKKLSEEKLSQSLQGTVLTPDGKPAPRVSIALATHGGNSPYIEKGRVFQAQEPYTILTNENGKFKFTYIDFEAESKGRQAPPGQKKVDFILFFLHDSGFRRLTQQEWLSLGEDKTVMLQPWCRIEGVVKVGTQPGKSLPVQCQIAFTNERLIYGIEPYATLHYDATTNESGKFVIEKVPASFVTVSRKVIFNNTGHGYMSTTSHSAEKIELKPGETATVTLGGVGRPVTGTLTASKEFETPPDWTFSRIECTPALEKVEFPMAAWNELRKKLEPKELFEGNDLDKRMEWLETEDGKKLQAAYDELTKDFKAAEERNQEKIANRRVCAVDRDGTFRLDDIPAGDWPLKVILDSPPPPGETCGFGEPIGTLEYEFSVAEISDGVSDEPLDLGTLEVKQLAKRKPLLQVGQTAPDFELPQILPATDGEAKKDAKLRLSDYKGKIIVLDFWAMWCAPCLQKMPELQKLYALHKDEPRFAMIGVSFDDDSAAETLSRFVAEKDFPWLHGLAGNMFESPMAKDYGVSSVPALLLIDADGKVLLSNPTVEEVAKKMEEMKR